MDFLNQAIGQVRELFLSMTPAARVTAMLLLGVIGVSLGYLFQYHSAGPSEYLFNGQFLTPTDADRATAAIAQAGLNDYEQVGNRIRVPRGQKALYLAAVADKGAMPTNFDTLLEDALDLGPFVDRKTREQRLKAARERQFSMMVRMMDGVEDAKVIYDFSESRGLSRGRQVTANVSVLPEPGEELNARRQKMIRKAVAASIAGLSPNDVNVINQMDGSTLDGGSAEIMAEAFDNPYFQNKVTYERLMKNNIEDLLRDIPGIRVQVTAELANTLQRTTTSVKPDGDGIAMSETKQEEEITSTKIEDGGRPGLAAQGPSRNGEQAELAKTENKTANNSIHTDSFVGHIQDKTVLAGLIPEQVRVAVAIPSDYLVSVWRETTKSAGEDDKPEKAARDLIEEALTKKIQKIIRPLLPKDPVKDPYEAIEVSVFETLTPEPFEGPTTAGQAVSWLNQNMNSMMMGGLALVSLVMLRSIVKSIPPSDPVPALSTPTLSIHRGPSDTADASDNEADESNEETRPRLKLKKGVSLKDDLTDIVREDPEAAAAILRTWIGNAG